MRDRACPVVVGIYTRYLGARSPLYNRKPELESHSVDRSLKRCLLVQPEALVNPRSWPLTLEKLSRYAMSD